MSEVTAEQVAECLRADLAAVLDCRPEELDLSDRVTALPGIDSARLIEVVVACEKRWEVVLDEDELFDVLTGQDLCDLIVHTAAHQGVS